MNKQRRLVVALGVSGLATPLVVFAQKKSEKIYRIGVLLGSNPAAVAHVNAALKRPIA